MAEESAAATAIDFETDPEKEVAGVWNNFGDFRVRLARMGGANAAAQRELAERSARLNVAKIKENEATTILRQVVVRHLVTGWQMLVDDDWRDGIALASGTVLPATRKNLLRRLAELPWLVNELFKAASDARAYAKDIAAIERQGLVEVEAA